MVTLNEEELKQRVQQYCTERMEEGFELASANFQDRIATLSEECASLKQHNITMTQEINRLHQLLSEVQSRPQGGHIDTSLDRINRINLLSKRDPKPFLDKSNFAEWSSNLRADIQPQIPELKPILDFAENFQDEHTEPLNNNDVKQNYGDLAVSIGITTQAIWAIDNKLWGLLHNLTREHSTAGNKIKQDNREECGAVAWYNLRNFYKDDSKEHQTNVLGKAFIVKRANNLDQLQVELDKWLTIISKTIKYKYKMFDSSGPNKTEADELKFVLLKQLVTQKISDTFKANKHDYNTFDKALAYVKELLRDHYDNNHPTPTQYPTTTLAHNRAIQ